jgi:hypothetical protein
MNYTERTTGNRIALPRVPYSGTQLSPEDGLDIARYRHTTSRAYTGSGTVGSDGFIRNWYNLRMALLESATVSTGLREGMTCLTCHFSHGTTAAATGFADGAGPTGGSALLYLPNRGVCNNCHWKGR